MSVIESRKDSAYGTAIALVVSDMTGREVSDAQVFVALRRLERQGLVASIPAPKSEPSKRTRGRPRVFYELTAAGKGALDAAGAYTNLVSADQHRAKERKHGRQEEASNIAPVVG